MCFFLEEPTHLLYKTALVLAVLRCLLNLTFNFKHLTYFFSANHPSDSPSVSSDNLVLTTFGEAKERMPWVSDTCAVCLSDLNQADHVRELSNCCHVFHQDCIDTWVDDHDHNRKTCPLCRAPLLASSQSLAWSNSEQPSWAVDRLLYLFGDDLLP
ncbi:hypothetical protein like AT5G20885 [Hibiscus trionum]|uniref:RING-type domain-containing protein n=1 Tax=Hibiscus trionum TaxID=183268 RepID=A0A9W7M5D4_HIBTR|nr:hypothetical protein like AT5G20885 [Hibiscus trionum]